MSNDANASNEFKNTITIHAIYDAYVAHYVDLPDGKTEKDVKAVRIAYDKGVIEFTDDTQFEFAAYPHMENGNWDTPTSISVDDGWESGGNRHELEKALKGLRNAIWDLEGWEQLEGLKEAVKAANEAIDPNFEE